MAEDKLKERELVTVEQFAALSPLEMEAILKMMQCRVGKALALTFKEQVGTAEYREKKLEYDNISYYYGLLLKEYHNALNLE